jgi:flagellar FliJ protein
LQEVAQSQGVLDIEQNKLVQLKRYKLEYLNKKQEDIGIYSAIELQEFNRFLQQLEDTISRQKDVIDLRQRELEQKRQTWNTTRIDSRVMHKVVDKLHKQESVEQERKEQKVLDEFAQRKNSLR